MKLKGNARKGIEIDPKTDTVIYVCNILELSNHYK